MRYGFGRENAVAGVIAAFMALASIFLAKLVMYASTTSSETGADPGFLSMFGRFDAIFLLLAVMSAWKVGAGASDDGD